ncbi:guanine nucleotide exchange factor DBS isoform X35 [Canis lupus familiaris]|uniref:MCF.2 cell line derived transforming sequence like n=2 Tax=Canis lupus familiaris TaxID=9615 RepID=A0A8P0P5J5_CANLF|nr:guanine nucleotide exchange factor DBS isoform X35 [Canis lupus familiaris]XP_038426016.1 guanine nucleotide exchange factor DBS isoform X24 [Canis lupus familiaris]|eukprot:XP_013961936.1 guanine nucleotide exchange factor DBS isoform X1 [Canis lupus familiaris]
MFDCWRSVLCKKTGSNLHSSLRRSDEAEKEEGDPQIDVPDVIRLVRDPPEQSHPPADEIMHQDITPLCAADIQDQLKKRFAYLSGGRGQDGSPVITFPDYPAFSDVPDKEFQNVMTYLTSIPSLQDAGIGFILVIDRRQDKWTSVKASILRIAASFPANLQLVLVLRPTGFFQRALSDLAFKFNRDDLKMKVPVIMLSSVPELHGYIDKSQLTEDLGGTLDYCHTRWLCHRTAIESFALMVKQTAQMLQSFGTELAETELPNDVQSTSSVLCAHTEKKDKAKEDMRLALDEGKSILENIREPLAKSGEQSLNQDELDNQTTVQRLLAQLNETEAAFDEFWAKHQQKLQQCLQLRHFEQDFREVKSSLDALAQKIATFTDVGNSLAHAEHLLKDLASFEEKSSASVKRAHTLSLEGEKLIDTKHYAVDSIRPKCHELQYLCDQFAAEVERRRGLLSKSLELHGLLEASMKWCDEGIYLLASQPVDKCQSQDGAEAALQEIEKFLETGAENKIQELNKIYQDYESILTKDLMEHVQKVFQKQEGMEEMFHRRQASLKKLAAKQMRPVQPVAPRPEALTKSPCPSPGSRRGSENSSEGSTLRRGPYRRAKSEASEGRQGRSSSTGHEEESLAVLRRHVMNELLDTERVYVEELLCVLEGYAAELDNPLMAHLMSPGLQNKKDILFGNMEEIYHFHNRIFLRELEEYTDCPELVGRCFLERMEEFQIYEKYCQNKPRSESLWRQCSDCPFFQECQRKLDHKLSLDSYLLKPVQRITKYQLLLKEMLKYSKSCEGAEDLQEALSSILGILKAVNDSMHLIAITGYDGNLSDLGKLLMQGSFSVWTDHKKGHSKVKDLARFKPMQRHLFLHEKAVLFCKKREENGEGYEKAPSYSYKQSLNMAAVGITENVKGDVRKFEIWYNAREEVYIVQAPTPEVKAAWVSEIRKVLTSQLQACREASQHRTLEQSQSLPLPTPPSTSPSKGTTRNIKKLEERKTDPLSLEGYMSPSSLPKPPEKGRDDMVTSSTSESSALSRKRFTLQGFANLKGQKASPTSPDKKPKRHEVKSDPTPFGLRGWSKTSHPLEAPEDNDGWSSAEELMNSSDAEEEGRVGPRKLVPGKYTVVVDDEKGSPEALAVRNGDMVEVVQEGDEGLWYVRNLTSSKESWVPASSLSALLGVSGSAQCLSSSESSAGSTLLSASSSCSESCGVPLSDLQG